METWPSRSSSISPLAHNFFSMVPITNLPPIFNPLQASFSPLRRYPGFLPSDTTLCLPRRRIRVVSRAMCLLLLILSWLFVWPMILSSVSLHINDPFGSMAGLYPPLDKYLIVLAMRFAKHNSRLNPCTYPAIRAWLGWSWALYYFINSIKLYKSAPIKYKHSS